MTDRAGSPTLREPAAHKSLQSTFGDRHERIKLFAFVYLSPGFSLSHFVQSYTLIPRCEPKAAIRRREVELWELFAECIIVSNSNAAMGNPIRSRNIFALHLGCWLPVSMILDAEHTYTWMSKNVRHQPRDLHVARGSISRTRDETW